MAKPSPFARPFLFTAALTVAMAGIPGCKPRNAEVSALRDAETEDFDSVESILQRLEVDATQQLYAVNSAYSPIGGLETQQAFALDDAVRPETIAQLDAQIPGLLDAFQKTLKSERPSKLDKQKVAQLVTDLQALRRKVADMTASETQHAKDVVDKLAAVAAVPVAENTVPKENGPGCPVGLQAFNYLLTVTPAAASIIELRIGIYATPEYWKRVCPTMKVVTKLREGDTSLTFDLQDLSLVPDSMDGVNMMKGPAAYKVLFDSNHQWSAEGAATLAIRKSNEALQAHVASLVELASAKKKSEEEKAEAAKIAASCELHCCSNAEFQRLHPGKQGQYDDKKCVRLKQ